MRRRSLLAFLLAPLVPVKAAAPVPRLIVGPYFGPLPASMGGILGGAIGGNVGGQIDGPFSYTEVRLGNDWRPRSISVNGRLVWTRAA